ATTGEFAQIPHRDRYILSPNVLATITSEKVRMQRVCILKYGWEKGGRPYSIKALDQLREKPGTPYYINLLEPVSYDGTQIDCDGIPLSHPFLKSLAYLTSSIICGGSISIIGDAVIRDPKKEGIVLRNKLAGCIIRSSKAKKDFYQLKRAYADLLVLTGIKRGSLVNGNVEDVMVPYISNLIQYVDDSVLSMQDKNHALEVISEFLKGVLDHKMSITKHGSRVVRLPMFKKRDPAKKFTEVFKKAFDLIYPEVKHSLSYKVSEINSVQYYHSMLIVPKHEFL
ncbi:MAG: hypothetical protein NT096_18075, partial [Proteobacteria bacterium]|nr:hypothetical protein [Pseudomonadota bacterium]